MVNRYDEILLSKDNQELIKTYTKACYHTGAEIIRKRHGYSSGAIGADFIPMDPSHYMYDNQFREIGTAFDNKKLSKKILRERLKELRHHFYGAYQIFYKTIHFYQVKIDELTIENTRLKMRMSNYYGLYDFVGRNGEYVILKAKNKDEINEKIAKLKGIQND